MKKIIGLMAMLFFCGTAFSQIYTPVEPTVYGDNVNRIKPFLALHLPMKDGLTTNTSDTSAQIFYNKSDGEIYIWTQSRGFFKITVGGGGAGVSSVVLVDSPLLATPLTGDTVLFHLDTTSARGIATQHDLVGLGGGGGGPSVNIYNSDGVIGGPSEMRRAEIPYLGYLRFVAIDEVSGDSSFVDQSSGNWGAYYGNNADRTLSFTLFPSVADHSVYNAATGISAAFRARRDSGLFIADFGSPTKRFGLRYSGDDSTYWQPKTLVTKEWVIARLAGAGGGSADWKLTGNTGTDTSVNFIGTLDDKDIAFRRNNLRYGSIGRNIFLGRESGSAANGGNANIGIGQSTIASALNVQSSIAIGNRALGNMMQGIENIAIGINSVGGGLTDGFGEGDGNIGIGVLALAFNTTGFGNIGIGNTSLQNNSTGRNNVAVGLGSLESNTTGQNNIAIGRYSGRYKSPTSSNEIFINSLERSTYTGDTTLSIVYAIQSIGTAVTQRFKINGMLHLPVGASNGFVLTSNASGIASWQAPTGGGGGITALTGDVTASGAGSVAATLATVNANVGSFTNANVTVNAKGLITAVSNGSAGTSSQWTTVGSDIYYNTGAVLVGSTTNPYTANKFYVAQPNVTALNPTGDIIFDNPTLATVSVQQRPPSIAMFGSGWKTNATAGPIHVGWFLDATVASGANNPSTTFSLTPEIGAVKQAAFSFGSTGNFQAPANITAGNGASTRLGWGSRSFMVSPIDGNIAFTNFAGTDFGMFQLGGLTNAFPAIKRSGATVQIRLADDAGYAGLSTGAATINGTLTIPTGAAAGSVLTSDGSGVATWQAAAAGLTATANVATWMNTPTSANLFTAMTDKTGTGGNLVFSTSPTINTALAVNGGTVTTSTPALNITQTWNNGATGFNGIYANFTNTASATTSYPLVLQVSGVTQFYIDKVGNAVAIGAIQAAGLTSTNTFTVNAGVANFNRSNPASTASGIALSGSYTPASGTLYSLVANNTINPTSGTLIQNGITNANTINQTGGANGITRGFYNVPILTSAFDYRAIESSNGPISFTDSYASGSGAKSTPILNMAQTWNTTGSPTAITLNVTNTASGTTAKLIDLQVATVSQFSVSKAGEVVINGTLRHKAYTVATLPAAGTAGRMAYVTDATAPTYLGALTGGGGVTCPVFDNGTIWVSH